MSNYVVLKNLNEDNLVPVTKKEAVKGLDEALAQKQDVLVSGTNIKTVGGQSLLGTGNIVLPSGGGVTSYNDLTDKPTIPTKISDLTNDSGYLTQHQDVSGKADKATTLSGYGITDAKIENGTITLGNSTVTPITSHQDISGKQETLVSGSNIKTINGVSILGSGDITVGTGGTFVQTQADWNQSDNTAVDYIKNKPTIPNNIATLSDLNSKQDKIDINNKLSYNLLTDTPVIPAAQVQANWNESDPNSMAFIANKPSIPSGVTVDQIYNGSSTNAQSGVAIASALSGKQDVIDASHKLDYSLLSNTPTIPASIDVSGKEDVSNKVTSLSSNSTHDQYPSARCVYDIVAGIETLLAAL